MDAAWRELAGIQQAGLDAALAAQSKARKSKPSKPAPALTDATASGLRPQSHDSNGNAEGSSVLPDHETTLVAGAGQAREVPETLDYGVLASEENQAANTQMSVSTNLPVMSMSKDQVCLPKILCLDSATLRRVHSSKFLHTTMCISSMWCGALDTAH